jgi:formylglycine-generating enzyme required for sulfatase activity
VPDATPFDASGCSHPPVKTDCSAGWCKVPAGCFVIGSPDNEWGRALVSEEQAKVTLTHAFLIG